MNFFLFLLLVGGCVAAAVHAYATRKIGYATVPFLSGAILLVWFAPQAAIALGAPFLPQAGLRVLLLLAVLSFAGLLAGWSLGRKGRFQPMASRSGSTPLREMIGRVGRARYQVVAGGFVAVALLIQALIQMQPEEVLLASQPTGLITILQFLSSINPVALFLALSNWLYRRSAVSSALLAFAALAYAAPVLLSFKRNEIIELAVTVAFCLWAMRRIAVPKFALPVMVVVGLAVMFGAAEIRHRAGYAVSADGSLERRAVSVHDIQEIDWPDVIQSAMSEEAYEVSNAIYVLEYLSTYRNLGFGTSFWNEFVRKWVPGQFVGADFKESLYFERLSIAVPLEMWGADYKRGTTATGFVEVYQDFDLAAALLFVLMGYIARRAYQRGLAGDVASAPVYPSMAILCVVSLTHGGYTFFLTLPVLLACQFAIRHGCRMGRHERVRRSSARDVLLMPQAQ